MVSIRPALAGLPAYKPGRSPDDLARELGLPRAIKLASNETAMPPLPGVLEAVAAAATGINRYPDNGGVALTEALADRYGVRPSQVALGCGSVAICQYVVQAFADPGDEVVYGWRSFEAYPLFPPVAGAVSVQVPLDASMTYDLEAMAEVVTPLTKVVFVCNPNNPTSTAVRRDALVRFLDSVPGDVVVVLDEAYREFVTDPDVPDGLTLLEGRPNVVVLRTFSKAYGLAGLRVGYAIGDEGLITALRTLFLPFSVSTVAQTAAITSLGLDAELAVRVKGVVSERARLTEALESLGWPVPDSQANFVWLPLGEDSAPVAAAFESRGIILRPFAGDGVRVTVGSPDENDAFLGVAAEVLPGR